MKKQKWTLRKWQKWVGNNSKDSYSLVTCLAILELIEYRAKDEEECGKVLHKIELGLSGAQAMSAIGWHLKNEVEGLPDKEMAAVSNL